MRAVITLLLAAGLGLSSISACSDPGQAPSAGSNSNWLVPCDVDADCGSATSCECGACTVGCETDADCAALEGARCTTASSALTAQCGVSRPVAGICQPACVLGGCGPERACVFSRCVLDAVPDSELCPALASPDEARIDADRLIEVVETMRISGGVSCGTGTPTQPAAALRVDGRLSCAARAMAADIASTRMTGLTDSRGRDTPTRMSLAGYTSQFWAEGLAIGVSSAEDALAVMLASPSSCLGLTHPDAVELGVARVGDAFVVTLGAP